MAKKSVDMSELELKYHDITELYDLAEELVDTAESEFVKKQDDQLALVEPLVETVGESTDLLTEAFCALAGNEKSNPMASASKIETALRKIYVAVDVFRKKSKAMSEGVMNIADPIVTKIKRQVEVVIANFIDFVEISLDRIMQKTQIQELKKRQEKIAIMLHDIGQGVELQR